MMKKFTILSVSLFILLWIVSFSLKAQSIYDQLAGKIYAVVDTGGNGDYKTVAEAISSIPDNNDTWKVIFVRKGTYYEKIVLGYKKTHVILVGEDVDSTKITYSDYASLYDNAIQHGHTFSTYTFRADANDFQAYNITFECTAGTKGQGVAFHSNGDHQILYHCRLLGYQDTYFDNFRTRRYIKDCFIEGAVDYIFGWGVTLFDSCQIHTSAAGYISAAATPQYYEFGYVFKDCRLTTGLGISSVSLGRPWFDWSNICYFQCWEPQGIIPGGWTTWSEREKTCIYREFDCFGPGSDTTNRVYFGKQLDPAKAPRYNIDTIFAASNFPTYLGYDGDTAELMFLFRRFQNSGYPERADTILYAGRDHYPTYPTDNWSPVFYDTVYQVIKNSTYRMMDSINGKITIDKLLIDGEELPGFDPGVLNYGVELNESDTVSPDIAIVGEGVSASVTYPTSLPGFAKITALSRDKVNGNIYSIYLSKDSSYWDTRPKFIVINRKDSIIPEKGKYSYNLRLQPGDTIIKYSFVYLKYNGQSYEKILPPSVPGVIKIAMTAINESLTDTFFIHVDLPSEVSDLPVLNSQSLSLISPVYDKLLIENKQNISMSPEIKIFDLQGKLIYSGIIHNLPNGISEVAIDLNRIKSGIYFYNIKYMDKVLNGKLISLHP